MKKIIFILIAIITFSCSKDLTTMNVDTKSATVVPGETLFSNAQKNLVDYIASTNVNTNIYKMFAQYWTETTYTDEANFDVATRSVALQQWNNNYRDVLKDFDESSKLITASDDNGFPAVKQNKLAIAEILTVYTYKMLVDTFGNIPYTQALDATNANPVYDDAATIYTDLLARLNTAIGNLNTSADSFGDADLIYGGNVAAWKKFANGIKLQFGIMMNDATTAAAGAAGTFTSNADNAKLQYLAAPPNTNPLWVDLVQSGRSDFVIANTFADKLNALNDPRRAFYFADNLGANTYVGGPYGDNNGFTKYTHINDAIEDPTFPCTIMNYAETEFMKAEAIEMGLVSGTAATNYNNGVTASIEEWGGTSADAATYLAQPSVAYATAAPTWQEKVGTQAWIALYLNGFDAWTTWRRLDYPVLNIPVISGLPVPVRMTYPALEQTLNGTNYSAAASAIGGDNLTTKLFWDKN